MDDSQIAWPMTEASRVCPGDRLLPDVAAESGGGILRSGTDAHPHYSYLDLAAVWSATRNLQIRLGVNNVLDKGPPLTPSEASSSSGQINTFQVDDLLGREIFAAFRAMF